MPSRLFAREDCIDKREDGHGEDSRDDDAAERGPSDTGAHFAAQPLSQCHREHAEAGGEDEHENGAERVAKRLDHGFASGQAGLLMLVHAVDDDDGRIDDDADEHHDAQQDEDGDAEARQAKDPEDADEAERKSDEDEERPAERFEDGGQRQRKKPFHHR